MCGPTAWKVAEETDLKRKQEMHTQLAQDAAKAREAVANELTVATGILAKRRCLGGGVASAEVAALVVVSGGSLL